MTVDMGPIVPISRKGNVDENEIRKSDWWAKEQVENAANYAKIQANLEELREQVKAHYGRSMEKGLTTYWAQELQNRTDLGKRGLRDEEQISLGELDSAVVSEHQFEFQSAGLTLEEIRECRGVWSKREWILNEKRKKRGGR